LEAWIRGVAVENSVLGKTFKSPFSKPFINEQPSLLKNKHSETAKRTKLSGTNQNFE